MEAHFNKRGIAADRTFQHPNTAATRVQFVAGRRLALISSYRTVQSSLIQQ